MNYKFQVKFALPGDAIQIMYFDEKTKNHVGAIAHDIQALNYSIQRL